MTIYGKKKEACDDFILNDTMCRVHMQENMFMNFIQKVIEEEIPLNF